MSPLSTLAQVGIISKPPDSWEPPTPYFYHSLLLASKLAQPSMEWLYKCYLKDWQPFRGIMPSWHSCWKLWMVLGWPLSNPSPPRHTWVSAQKDPLIPASLMAAPGQPLAGSHRDGWWVKASWSMWLWLWRFHSKCVRSAPMCVCLLRSNKSNLVWERNGERQG